MKKTLISLAIIAGMASSGAALAEATVYGNVHVSINDLDSQVNGPRMTSNTSHLGFKASEDLGDGMKAYAKFEFQPDVVANGAVGNRDAFVGLKGGMGTATFGTISSNYKQMGGKVDPMYRTILEGRGALLGTQSRLHNGNAINRGRQQSSVQLTSSEMGGIQAVFNTTMSNAVDETMGVGFRYSGRNFMVYFDWIDQVPLVGVTATESATKFGGKYEMDALTIGLQIEMAEDVTGEDYTYLSASYKVSRNDMIAFSYGAVAAKAVNSDRTGIALMYKHKMSKMTSLYAGYGDRSDDITAAEDNGLTFGIQKKF